MNTLTVDDKVIFLDIDGVLNNIFLIRGRDPIDPVCMNTFNCLVDQTGAKIVVSSTWRFGETVETMTNLLRLKGLKHDVYSLTPERKGCRGEEIEEWLTAHTEPYMNFHEYLILDDDSDMLYHQRENFIHCPMDTGLTPTIAYRAWRTLMSKRNWDERNIECYEKDFGLSEYIESKKR